MFVENKGVIALFWLVFVGIKKICCLFVRSYSIKLDNGGLKYVTLIVYEKH